MNLRSIVALAFAATVAFGMAAAATPVLGGPDSDGTAPAAPKTATTATTATTVVKTAPADPAANTVAAKAWAIVSPPGAPSRPVPTWVRPPQPGHAAARRDAPPPRSRRHHARTHARPAVGRANERQVAGGRTNPEKRGAAVGDRTRRQRG
jgi:hypothetical protein